MNNPRLLPTIVFRIIVVLLCACDHDPNSPEAEWAYQVTSGACGHLVYAEKLGPDSASALGVVEARKIEAYGEGGFALEPCRLQVVDRYGEIPQERFYAIRVLDAETGTHLHSVSEVIATDGDLFTLAWCPD
mgnify:CR=1 FL=1